MVESESEGFETCSGSSRQKTDATTVATEFDILPNYLISTSKPLERFNPDDEFEESGELGAGNDSDYDAENLDEHVMDPSDLQPEDDTNEVALDDMSNFVFVAKGKIKDSDGNELKVASVPPEWKMPEPKIEMEEPNFDSVDNPGSWDAYSFRPKYKKEKGGPKKYEKHQLPSGCTPVPVNSEQKREMGDWEFFYSGWEPENNDGVCREDTSLKDLFPKSRLGCLDVDVLRELGMNAKVMETDNFLFFYQLILPICDTKKSGIDDDPRMSYYSAVERWSNFYAVHLGLGGTYGHSFRNVTAKELLRHDACVVRDGVRGGSGGAIYRRWMHGCSDYDDAVYDSQTHRRWLQIKRVKKLCNNDVCPKRGEEGYDPTYKYDYI